MNFKILYGLSKTQNCVWPLKNFEPSRSKYTWCRLKKSLEILEISCPSWTKKSIPSLLSSSAGSPARRPSRPARGPWGPSWPSSPAGSSSCSSAPAAASSAARPGPPRSAHLRTRARHTAGSAGGARGQISSVGNSVGAGHWECACGRARTRARRVAQRTSLPLNCHGRGRATRGSRARSPRGAPCRVKRALAPGPGLARLGGRRFGPRCGDEESSWRATSSISIQVERRHRHQPRQAPVRFVIFC